MAEQVPFGNAAIELASNPEPRCPCVLLLDVSGSMAGRPVAELNSALRTFQTELQADALAAQRVEVAIVTFGGRVDVLQDFHGAQHFQAPTVIPSGDTPLGEAVRRGVELVAQRKVLYKQAGLHYFRPWIVLITDGEPTDEWQSSAELVRQGEAAKKFALYAVGTEGANFDILRQIANEPLKLQGMNYRELFKWLSASLGGVSRSQPGQPVALPSPSKWSQAGA